VKQANSYSQTCLTVECCIHCIVLFSDVNKILFLITKTTLKPKLFGQGGCTTLHIKTKTKIVSIMNVVIHNYEALLMSTEC